MLSGLKGRPEIRHMLTQCREAAIENRCHGHLLYIHCQAEKSVLFILMFVFLGENIIHVLFTVCCNNGEFFPFLPFITVVKTGIMMCSFISPTSNVYSSFVIL